MASKEKCWKNCLKGQSAIPWYLVALIIGLLGLLVVASGGQIALFGIILLATFTNLGIAMGAGAITALAICLLNCRK